VFAGAQSGVFVAALSAVETALWDLAGKALNVPVYQLLGGKFRDRIRVYCDTALYQTKLPTPDHFAQAATKAVKDGYTAMRAQIESVKPSPRTSWESGRNKRAGGIRYDRNMPIESD